MTIKELAALLTVFAGIVANLMFQDSLATHTGAEDWRLPQRPVPLQSTPPSPSLLALDGTRRVTVVDGLTVGEVGVADDEGNDPSRLGDGRPVGAVH